VAGRGDRKARIADEGADTIIYLANGDSLQTTNVYTQFTRITARTENEQQNSKCTINRLNIPANIRPAILLIRYSVHSITTENAFLLVRFTVFEFCFRWNFYGE